MSPLAKQRAFIVVAVAVALGLALAVLFGAHTTSTVRVVVGGVLLGLVVAAMITVYRNDGGNA